MAKVKGFKTKALNAEDNIFTALDFDLTTSANLRLRAELMLVMEKRGQMNVCLVCHPGRG